jgi:hypothetical protein
MLGLFMGSRGSEHVQAIARQRKFTRVPPAAAAGDFVNALMAFMASDFAFFDKQCCLVTHPQALHCPDRAAELRVRFWHDKSPQNFTVQRFCRSGHAHICPVKRSISTLRRCCMLGVGPLKPIGVVERDRAATSSWKRPHMCLKSEAVIGAVRQVVIRVCPNPTHRLRLPENRFLIDCHSNRVTAAVALHLAGKSVDMVAFWLRWNPVSVKHCLRECSQETGDVAVCLIQAHHRLQSSAIQRVELAGCRVFPIGATWSLCL